MEGNAAAVAGQPAGDRGDRFIERIARETRSLMNAKCGRQNAKVKMKG
jgi:hypothetical protein